MASLTRIALGSVNAFTAVTAVAGGVALMTGAGRFPVAWLAGTPFADYTLPGLILALGVGGTALIATVTTFFRSARTAGRASIGAGLALLAWIVGEIVVFTGDGQAVSTMEGVYLAVGVAMAVLGVTVARVEGGATSPGPLDDRSRSRDQISV